jgi:uncharacterized Zn finger protein/DNA-binding XRE family transcriptional regulator
MAYYWSPYIPVAQRRAKALRKMKQLRKKGKNIQPIEIEGRTIARSFWGKAWCEHLESFSDFENRLPRGRTYARNGSVCHLTVETGQIKAIVSGSELYNVKIKIKPLNASVWKAIKSRCSGQIGSMLELLQGRLSDHVMSIVTDRTEGLLPLPGQIELRCDCPDWAEMCKHVAAVLYGVGNRLDSRPELLFTLRNVDANELIAGDISLPDSVAGAGRTIADDRIADIFGVDIDVDVEGAREPLSESPEKEERATRRVGTVRKHKKPSSARRHRVTTVKKKTGISEIAGRKKSSVKRAAIENDTETSELPRIRPTGKSVARLRSQLKLSVSEFAERLEVTPASIYRWEKTSGRLKLRSQTFIALARLHQHIRAHTTP